MEQKSRNIINKLLIISSLITLIFILFFALLLYYIFTKSEQDTKVKSDAIIVLGGHVISGTSCTGPICQQKEKLAMRPHFNPCVVARVDHAVSLYKKGFAPKIVMSGGNDEETNANEAETMKKMAIDSGITEVDILTENKSTSTYENLKLSQKILADTKLHSVIIVTEPYHIARAGLVATKLKYNYTLSPAIENICWNKNDFFANWNFIKKEPFAIIGYKVVNKI